MMKTLIFLLLFGVFFSHAQQKSTEDFTKIQTTQPAQFPGGDDAFRAELHKMIRGYIDLQQYAVNGVFDFILSIDEKGKITKVNVLPKVKNSDMFIDDMTFAVKRIKTRWKPALRDGTPVKHTYLIKINFTTDHFDHD